MVVTAVAERRARGRGRRRRGADPRAARRRRSRRPCCCCAPLPCTRPAWHRREAREILRFGLPSLGSGLASIGAQYIDYAVVAARLPAAAVGLYWRAYTLGVDYQSKLSGILVQIGLPLYARAADLATQRGDARADRPPPDAACCSRCSAALILLAPVADPADLRPGWEDAVEPTQILAVAGMMAAIQAGTGPLLLAVGKPGALLRWNLSKLIGPRRRRLRRRPARSGAAGRRGDGLQRPAVADRPADPAAPLRGHRRPRALDRLPAGDRRDRADARRGLARPPGRRGARLSEGVACAAAAAVGAGVYLLALAVLFPSAMTELREVSDRLLPRGLRLGRPGYTGA